MAKAKLKTAPTKQSVAAFLNSIDNDQRREDAKKLAQLFRKVTGKQAKMWGASIVGYGKYHYEYDSGREGEFLRAGFSPRKDQLVVYIMPGYTDHGAILRRLGKHKKGKSCVYIRKLDDVDLPTLERLVKAGWKDMERRYGKA